MRAELVPLVILAVAVAACGVSHPSRPPGDSSPPVTFVSCPETTDVVKLAFAADGVSIVATKDLRVARNVDQKPIAVTNDTATDDGDCFILGRDGVGLDGAFDHTGAYDAARYPYHLAAYIWPQDPGAACTGTSSATAYFGLSGSVTIGSLAPTFVGSVDVGTLTFYDNCWTDPAGAAADTAGCQLLPGRLSACFRVASGI